MKFRCILLFLLCYSISFVAQEKISQFQIINQLSENNITAIIQDEIGHLILGTKNNGIIYFDGKETTVFNDKSGLISNQINAIYHKNDSLFIATDKGLCIRINNRFITINNKEIYSIYYSNNKCYFTSKKGISVLKNDRLEAVRLPLEIIQQKINDLIFDGNYFWIATNKNLFKIDNLENPKQVITVAKGNFTSLLHNTNKLLVSDANKGLFLVKKQQLGAKINNNSTISKVKNIENQLWLFLDNNGIELIKTDTHTFVRKINKYNSIISEVANTVFEDHQNTVWLGTTSGLYKLKNATNHASKNNKPEVFLTNVEVLYQSLDSVTINTYENELQLSPAQHHISFSFKSVDLAAPNSILYRYKLKNEFSPWSKNNIVNFANLEAGSYLFSYQSKIGNLESGLRKFRFKIALPFYKKTIFLVMISIALLLFVLLISRFKMNQIKRKKNKKIAQLKLENHLISLEQKAMQLQMNPHFIFNVLNGIKAYGVSGDKDKLSDTISKFSKLLRSVLNSSKLEEISLQSEIDTLKNYIELAQEISPFSFEFKIEKKLKNVSDEEVLIPPMLLQPFVENAIEHAFTTETKGNTIIISFEIKNDFLYCFVQDNGIGIYNHKKQKSNTGHKSLAIEITKERIKNSTKYNQFKIEEIKEDNSISGTKISFKIPLKTDY